MSGYLARLAARAGGAPAAAGPRLPSLFEPSTTDGSTDAETPGTLAHDRHSPEVGAETLVDERAPADTHARAVAALPVPADRTPRGAEAEAAAPALPTNAPVHTRPTPSPEGSALAHPPATAALRVEAAPPPRAAARPATAAHRDEAAAAVTQPDVVHVTIERIEVRATVAAAPPIARSTPQRRETERSLHDYLAGKSR
jgi:hypothetical protein